jgi:hypothetical protein
MSHLTWATGGMSFSSASDEAAAAADRTPFNRVHCLLLLLLLLPLLLCSVV